MAEINTDTNVRNSLKCCSNMLQNVRGALAIKIETSRYYNQAYVFVNQLAK